MSICKHRENTLKNGKKVCTYADKVSGHTAICVKQYKLTFFCYHTEQVNGCYTGDAELVSFEDTATT